MARVGFIGLGTMGAPMAENLIRAGHEMWFYCRRDEVAEPFLSLGAERVSTPADVAHAADWLFTIVTADAEVREVALGPNGLIEGTGGGEKGLVDMSTISPTTIREVGRLMAERKVDVLDAPVSGGPWGAKSGTLSIMVGGETEVFERAEPLLQSMGDKIFHLGPLGAGQTAKLVNQVVAGGIMALVAEGFTLGKAAGLDLEQLFDVMCSSSAQSSLLEARGKKFVLSDNYRPGFTTALMRKDVSLAVHLAESLGLPMPLGSEVLQQYIATERRGYREEDFAAIAKWAAENADVKLV